MGRCGIPSAGRCCSNEPICPADPLLVPEASILERLAAGRFGPTRLALVLATVALPFVVVSTAVYEDLAPPDMIVELSPLAAERLVTLVPAVIVAALLAGTLGGWLVRRRFRLGAVATFVIAWTVAIAALPLGPSLARLRGCCDLGLGGYGINTADPAAGVAALAYGWWISPLAAPVPFVVLLFGVVLWARAVHAKGQAPSPPAFSVTRPSGASSGATPPPA